MVIAAKIKTEIICGYPVVSETRQKCLDQILSLIELGSTGNYFACANPHSLEIARKDTLFNKALLDSALLVPDGVGIVMASYILGGNIKERITGSDVFEDIHQELNHRGGYSVFFLGATEEVLALISMRMRQEYPNIKFAGSYAPPFAESFTVEENERIVSMINQACPDVLWVGMTAPRQEKWIFLNREHLNVKFIGPIGAVFDFYAGTVIRSSPFFQSLGLEWLPRFMQQPRKLWRRNFVSSPLFLLHAIFEKIRIKSQSS